MYLMLNNVKKWQFCFLYLGPVIGMEYNGDNCIQTCQEVIVGITKGTTGLVFISQSRDTADQQIENYYNFADMQMAVWNREKSRRETSAGLIVSFVHFYHNRNTLFLLFATCT